MRASFVRMVASAMILWLTPGKLEIELEAGDAGFGAAKLAIHVAEMIFGADDVGEQLVALQLAAFADSR